MFRLAFGLILAAGTALADCPTPSDLEGGGIWIRDSDGATTHFTRNAAGNIEEWTQYDDQSGLWIEAYRGVYILNEANIENRKIVETARGTSTWSVPLDQLPAPEPGASWQGGISFKNSNGTVAQTMKIKFGPRMELDISGCQIGAVPADYTVLEDGGGYTGRLLVTDLGVSLFVASGLPDGFYTDFYRIVEISREPLR
jgi:hypothetical protein